MRAQASGAKHACSLFALVFSHHGDARSHRALADVVGCLRQGVPPLAPNVISPVCSEPPCEGAIGPPFSTCLAIASACVATCDTIAVETLTPPLCTAGGEVDPAAIERYSRSLDPLDPMFIAFIGCYTVGLIFFFIM